MRAEEDIKFEINKMLDRFNSKDVTAVGTPIFFVIFKEMTAQWFIRTDCEDKKDLIQSMLADIGSGKAAGKEKKFKNEG